MPSKAKQINIRPDPDTLAFLGLLGDNPSAGAVSGLEILDRIYRAELAQASGIFSAGELSAMIDVLNGRELTPRMIGEHLPADLHDGEALEGLAEKWEYPTGLWKRVADLFPLSRIVLEIWAKAFWRQTAKTLEEYVGPMASKEQDPISRIVPRAHDFAGKARKEQGK